MTLGILVDCLKGGSDYDDQDITRGGKDDDRAGNTSDYGGLGNV
jgi:hypothetical protein